ncbi:saccharopine dehydrogenase NADP-binding domain-containing protein [Actinomadura sp. ATCC 31491]|uniref:Saccharopine dehydrogenase NADP-binding domain-containing protein n=1 Tax=Actinomadura luzonensis TaxID=2805427 RepID=A0ABT0G6J8_9ACTN|nr:saccharopine dehydrogenase NADP-binding domain-containing protein [Actinomadura luzonensis]MCK2220223.1 saccharopine dehydrogenase NADP-binding domain-containing protein [Actinomadura luzonensis]
MSRPIAVYGATGHTGRLAAAELLARGREVVLAGRDEQALHALAGELGGKTRVHHAPLDDPAALRALAGQAGVLIHCAGPFTDTGRPVALAAAEAGCPYVDHALEQHHTKWMVDELPEPGVPMVTAMSFYGGMGDLLAGAVAAGLDDIDRVVTAYAVSGWRLTTGARKTAELLFADTRRITFDGGEQHVGYVEPRNAVFPFPPPLGPRTMIAPVPFPEVVTVPRHVAARRVEAQLTAHTFEEEQAFGSEHVDAATRAGSGFTVACQVITAGGGGAAGRPPRPGGSRARWRCRPATPRHGRRPPAATPARAAAAALGVVALGRRSWLVAPPAT